MHSSDRQIEIEIPLPGTTAPIRIVFYSLRSWMLTVALIALIVAAFRADWSYAWRAYGGFAASIVQERAQLP